MPKIDAVVFDVLGTLVDEPAGIRAAIREFAPGLGEDRVGKLSRVWEEHVAREQQRIVDGARPFVPSDVIDREAAQAVAEAAGKPGDATVLTGRRSAPWPDSVAGLAAIAARYPVIGLSNASRSSLLELNAHAGLRWHQALSAEDARTYKPAPAVYRLAVTAAARPPERLLMVAAHAWDLRGAQAVGLRTAHVERPVGDPPADGDRFDLYATSLADLADQLT